MLLLSFIPSRSERISIFNSNIFKVHLPTIHKCREDKEQNHTPGRFPCWNRCTKTEFKTKNDLKLQIDSLLKTWLKSQSVNKSINRAKHNQINFPCCKQWLKHRVSMKTIFRPKHNHIVSFLQIVARKHSVLMRATSS